MRKVEAANQPISRNQPVTKQSNLAGQAEQIIICCDDLIEDTQEPKPSDSSYPSLSLRQRIEIIQRLKEKNGIECQAAIFDGGFLEIIIAAAVGGAIAKGVEMFADWLRGKNKTNGGNNIVDDTNGLPEVDKKEKVFKEAGAALEKAKSLLGKYHDNDLTGVCTAERLRGVQTLRNGEIDNPQYVVLVIEDAITKINNHFHTRRINPGKYN